MTVLTVEVNLIKVYNRTSLIIKADLQHDFRLGISPNPLRESMLRVVYLLPENQNGLMEVYDMEGRLVYQQLLSVLGTGYRIWI